MSSPTIARTQPPFVGSEKETPSLTGADLTNNNALLTTEREVLAGRDEPRTSDIQELAYRLWHDRGCPHGSAEEDWLEAERQLLSKR